MSHKADVKINFTKMPNSINDNPNLSGLAKSVWLHIQSKPNGYKFAANRIAMSYKESEKVIARALRELEAHCLLAREQLPLGDDGFGVSYKLSVGVNEDNQYRSFQGDTVQGDTVQCDTETPYLNKTDINKTDINKIDSMKETHAYEFSGNGEVDIVVEEEKRKKKKENEYVSFLRKNGMIEAVEENYNKFKKVISNHYPELEKMESPLSIDEYFKLVTRYKSYYIQEMFSTMNNWKPLRKNNRSVYDTFINWSNRDLKKGVQILIAPQKKYFPNKSEYSRAVKKYKEQALT